MEKKPYEPTEEDYAKAEGLMSEQQRSISDIFQGSFLKMKKMGKEGMLFFRKAKEGSGGKITGKINGHDIVFNLALSENKLSCVENLCLVNGETIDKETADKIVDKFREMIISLTYIEELESEHREENTPLKKAVEDILR